MKMLSFKLLLGLFSLNIMLSSPTYAAQPTKLVATTVVLVHGAFANASSWAKVIPLLEARGLNVVAVYLPLSSLADDEAATRRAIELQKGPIVLVGHSWGGAVISQSGDDPKVKALVFVSAVAPNVGQSVNELTKDLPPPPWGPSVVKDSGGFLWLPKKTVLSEFAQDLPAAEARMIATTQGPWAARCSDDKLSVAAWRSKPSWWILPEHDHMVSPALQAKSAAIMKATLVRVDSSHVAMVKRPRQVADTIIAAALSVGGTVDVKASSLSPASSATR